MRKTSYCIISFAILPLLCSASQGADLVSVDFESGNLGAAGSAGDGWKFWTSGGNRATIGSTGRTFLTGSAGNDEALFIRPATPGASESDLEGAEFTTSTPLVVGQDDIVYLITETFSDIAVNSDQFFKVDVRWGKAGNGIAYGGFDSTAGGSTWSVNANYNTEGSNENRQGRAGVRDSSGSSTTAELVDLRYIGDEVSGGIGDTDSNPGDPANNFLDRSYVSKTIYRPGAGDGMQVNAEGQGIGFDGTNVVSTYNIEGTKDNPADGLELLPSYGQLEIDRVSVHLRRHIGAYDGLSVGNSDEVFNGFAGHSGLSTPFEPAIDGVIPNSADIQFGIKSIRIGVAGPGDFNLDGTVDGLDEAIAMANQGMVGATFFDGDFDNDGDVDADDLTVFGLAGDYNGDGMVDAADYTVWRDGGSPDDGAGGYSLWRDNYGATSVPSLASIPEPSTLTAAAALIGLVLPTRLDMRRRA